MFEKLYPYRFELFLTTQLLVLFGSIAMPISWFENWIMPLLLLLNISSGILLAFKKKRLFRFLLAFLAISALLVITGFINSAIDKNFNYAKLGSYFIFYAIVTVEIIKQVWKAKFVNKNVILGLVSGYISLGLLAFFLCLTIEILYPNSFSGLAIGSAATSEMTDQLMYYAYITLMTIGYGDILPVTAIAQKASIFIGLIGQFYLVILTAIVVGKYINQLSQPDEKNR
ncbi:ion channel [Psychroserpens jangbogonensis]|uniref:ion channel n=1 Tax=Psychroserpens jangbogonensis TaxID=1484460 RepID=UPI00053E56BE|nr:ion channel [Psychroserpens jangbogonensis]